MRGVGGWVGVGVGGERQRQEAQPCWVQGGPETQPPTPEGRCRRHVARRWLCDGLSMCSGTSAGRGSDRREREGEGGWQQGDACEEVLGRAGTAEQGRRAKGCGRAVCKQRPAAGHRYPCRESRMEIRPATSAPRPATCCSDSKRTSAADVRIGAATAGKRPAAAAAGSWRTVRATDASCSTRSAIGADSRDPGCRVIAKLCFVSRRTVGQ